MGKRRPFYALAGTSLAGLSNAHKQIAFQGVKRWFNVNLLPHGAA